MAGLQLVCALLFCALTPVNSDFVIEGLRKIQKRSTEKPAGDIEVYSVDINTKVTSRFAHNVITSRAVNRGNVSKEVFFDVDLPKSAFISNFSMIIDGVTYTGVIKEKEVAKKQYEKAVSRGQTAGLVKASGRKTEKFTVSVNVASESNVTFELVYEEMLKRHLGKYEFFIKVQPKALVKHYEIDVEIYEPQGISFLNAEASFITNDLLPAIKKSFSGKRGHISFKPTLDQQRSCPDCASTLMDGDFIVTYDVNRESPGNIQIVNGYFVHYFAPPKLTGVPKNVVYVIDKSQSMYGRKMDQTKNALLKILNDTEEHDYFNIVLFGSVFNMWRDSMVKATSENMEKAKGFVNQIRASGATNINDPMLKAIELLNKGYEMKQVPERSASLIILLTDGEANRGESNPSKIQENVKHANNGKYTVYSLAFGQSPDYSFLEKLALENSGVARRIYEDSDADLQLQGFYNEIANPTLVDIKMQYPENAIADVTQNNFKQYFDGSELVVAGRITDNDLNSFAVDVNAEGAEQSWKYSENIDLQEKDGVDKNLQYIFGDFTERLWAYITIQQLLEKRIHADPSEKANLTAKALDLSLKFNFVTPLTSMVVTKPEDKEKEEESFIADKFVEGREIPQHNFFFFFTRWSYLHSYPSYNPTDNFFDSDPHFVIKVPQKNDALCFNIQEEPGVVLNLIEDKELGIAVNGELTGNKKEENSVLSHETYFGRLGIVNKINMLRVEVTTEAITIMQGRITKMFTWEKKASVKKQGLNLVINKKANVTFSFEEGATFVIILHKAPKDHPLHRDFLGFYTLDDHMFSTEVHGLLGQFFHGIDYEISNIHETKVPNKPDATMKVKNKILTVTRGVQRDYRRDRKNSSEVACWFVHSNGEGLIDGTHTDYIVPDIFSIAD
ncbi:inter-alpha-trypsin inhibitor heavy chain H3-like [Lithobates pipiens]